MGPEPLVEHEQPEEESQGRKSLKNLVPVIHFKDIGFVITSFLPAQ